MKRTRLFLRAVACVMAFMMLLTIISGNMKIEYIFAETLDKGESWDGVSVQEPELSGREYRINNAAELAWLAMEVNNHNTFDGKSILITGNINLNEKEWLVIGNTKPENPCEIKGNLVIRNATINGLSISKGNIPNKGLFGSVRVWNVQIDNLSMLDVDISASTGSYDGFLFASLEIAESGRCDISDCNISGVVTERSLCGALIGYLAGVNDDVKLSVKNCNTKIRSTGYHFFVGDKVSGAVKGGLIGKWYAPANNNYLVLNGVYCDDILETYNEYGYNTCTTGGMIGEIEGNSRLFIYQCAVEGSLSSSGYSGFAGGIVGKLDSSDIYKQSDTYVTTSINSSWNAYGYQYNAGGFIEGPITKKPQGYIKNSYFAGVSNTSTAFIAKDRLGNDDSIKIYNCFYDYTKSKNQVYHTDWLCGKVNGTTFNCDKCATDDFKEVTRNAGWDFENIWIMGDTYPELRRRDFQLPKDFLEDLPIDMDVTTDQDIPSKNGFIESVYRANYFVKNPEMIEMQLGNDTPCNQLVRGAKETGMDVAVGAWKGLGALFDAADNPLNIADLTVERKDMYEAVLMNILETSFSESIIDERFEDKMNLCKKFTSSISALMEMEYKIDIYDANDFKDLTAEQKKSLSKYASDWFYAEQPDLRDLGEVFTGVMTALNTVKSIEDFYNRSVSCLLLNHIGEEMKVVLRQAYYDSKDINNLSLRLALQECVEIVDANVKELAAKILQESITTAGANSIKWLFKEVLWKDIMQSFYSLHPAAAMLMVTYKGVTLGVNQLLSTDKICEQYLKMLAMEDIESLFDETYSNLKKKFENSQSKEDAGAYLAAIDFSFYARDNDCDEAYKFVDIIDTAAVSKLAQAFGAKDASDTKNAIRKIQSYYKSSYEISVKGSGWIGYLEDDYPGSGLYEYYDDLYNHATNPTLKKQITAACPVDVYIYDKGGESVASSVGGVVSCTSDNISVIGIGDEKTFLFYDNQDYDVKYVGSNTGIMDITVQEFDENEIVERTVNYYDVALEREKTYEMSVKGENLSESSYGLTGKSSVDAVRPDYDSLAENTLYRATVEHGGMNYRSGLFFETDIHAGENVALYACVPEGSSFIKWESTAGNIFANAESADTTFRMPMKDVKITAIIKKNGDEPGGDSASGDSSSEEGNRSSIIKVQGITLSMSEASAENGTTIQLVATVKPDNATNKTLKWSSDNETVATVSNGLVRAVDGGKATIIAESQDGSGIKAACVVTVKKMSTVNKPGDSNPSSGSSSGGNGSGGSSSGGSESGGSNNGNSGSDKQPDSQVQVELSYYVITFNANGGAKLSRKKMTLLNDDNLGILPKVQRRNYIFNGWYTQKKGGKKVSSSTVLNAGTTLFARWTKVSKPSKVKSLTLKSKKAGQIAMSFRKVAGAKGYEIVYSTNNKFPSSSVKKEAAASAKKTIEKLKSGKKYYVRVRAYKVDSTGKKVYGAYSTVKNIKVK